jgi:hypothetical protein
MFKRDFMVTAVTVLLLAGCGGGGGGDSTPAPQPQPVPVVGEPDPVATTPPSTVDPDAPLKFREWARFAGLSRVWEFTDTVVEGDQAQIFAREFAGGVAAADYDGDGDTDLYVVGGNRTPNHLYRNDGNLTFVEIGASAGLDVTHRGSGPAFGDIDGDGDLDLFVGAVDGDPHYLFENRGGTFVDVTADSGITLVATVTVAATFGDYDQDGDLDLFLSHWAVDATPGSESLWRNNGDGTFVNVSADAGLDALIEDADASSQLGNQGDAPKIYTFTPNLSDIDGDGDPDLLFAADFRSSQVFRNDGAGFFTRITNRDVIKDQAGMGASVGDYDNDGDMDWFVTSIWEENTTFIGNRLYRNDGTGNFEDVTDAAGVANGSWGWGSCFADFDNDGNLDIFQVNGWRGTSGQSEVGTGTDGQGEQPFGSDKIRLFHAQGDGTFVESADGFGLDATGQGRSVACFDADRDGNLDIALTQNEETQLVFYRNDTDNDNHYLTIKLEGTGGNPYGIGAWISAETAAGTQVRELGGHNNFASHDPLEVHFGLGEATVVDVVVRWPDGSASRRDGLAADRVLTIAQDGLNQSLSVVRGGGDGAYAPGEMVSIEAAAPEKGYFFSHWSGDGITFVDRSVAATAFTMPARGVTVRANYTPGEGAGHDVSVARRWNELLLESVRNDFARPTVHARNLFHISAAMFDAWAHYGGGATPWLLGAERAGVACGRDVTTAPTDPTTARETALSYAAYRIIRHRFAGSPGAAVIERDADALMGALQLDLALASVDYGTGAVNPAAALGNHIGACYIAFGLADGANEASDYGNTAYQPVNARLAPDAPGNPDITDLNRWQPLALTEFIDQAGNPATSEPDFLSPEWGQVVPFSLASADVTTHRRDDFDYLVYHDPGAPPYLGGDLSAEYQWGFSLVSIWSSHLAPDDGVMLDISPGNIGNVGTYPSRFEDYRQFYDTLAGGDSGSGRALNPVTGLPYEAQIVPRGDYARVLAEFWADGPDSETPPGHWFVILNTVYDHPLQTTRFGGAGEPLPRLEWDVKGYFALGGAMHDAAITAWGIKGWYDYIRPISALRAMAALGQSSDPAGTSYHADGTPLESGFIELIESGDALAGDADEHVGKVKLLSWRGSAFIADPETDVAGVGWIRAEDWWPYQRPTFVTPPFAGYVSGHSTYSRAAAEVLTAMTGSEFFPGGMSGFEVEANNFLVFEEGPSVPMTLQWATYRDASDQCSLSRIWGGIHPPADDLPGRLAGAQIGEDAFARALSHFNGTAP